MLLFTWMISWSLLVPSMLLARELGLSCAPIWFILDYIIIFPSLNSILYSKFSLLDLCWNTVDMSVSLLRDLLKSSSCLMFCYWGILLQSIRLCPFWSRLFFVPIAMYSFASCAMSCRVMFWIFILLLFISFFHFAFHLLLCLNLRMSQFQQSPVPLQFFSWCGYSSWSNDPSLCLLYSGF